MSFNYNDAFAVSQITKKFLASKGYTPSEGDAWLQQDEQAWKEYCDANNGKYTPFPDIGAQPDEIQLAIMEFEEGIESKEQNRPDPILHKDMLVNQPQKDHTGKAKLLVGEMDRDLPRKKPKPGSINYAIFPGTTSRFDNSESTSDTVKLMAPNTVENAEADMHKKSPEVHSRDADGKPVEPGKDVLEKVNDPNFDSSHPEKDAIAENKIAHAPDKTDISSKEGTDEEKKKKDAAFAAKQAGTTSTR